MLARLLQVYETVLIPFGNGCRYDLVVARAGNFERIQCKTGRLRKGAVVFNAYSVVSSTGGSHGYRGEAELFGVYCPDNDQVYLVPVQDVPDGGHGYLRVEPSRNGQAKNVRLASQYEVGRNARLVIAVSTSPW